VQHSESKKTHLFTRILPELAAATPYFSLDAVKRRLDELQLAITEASLQSYMSDAMKNGVVHDAGRGWYSGLPEPIALDNKPVKGIISRIEKAFPLLEFSCWSTEQVNPYMHHLLAKFVTFIYADRDLISAVFDEMKTWKNYRIYLDPKKADARKFSVEEATVVIRPEPVQAPESHAHAAPIEKLLVDLTIENDALPLTGRGEVQDMAWRLVKAGRISMGALLRYAQRRHVQLAYVFGDNWSTNVTKSQ